MTVTPSLSSPNAWPLTDEWADIDQKIADLQRTADQAQTSSAVAASEVASAQKAIRELSTAKAEILEKGRLWDRDAQLQRALAERKAVADRVRQAIGAGGSLAESLKSALEDRLKPKLKIAAGGTLEGLNGDVLRAEAALEAEATSLTSLKRAFATAETNLKAAESDYQAKADAAEAAWLAIQNGARILEERLQVAQAQYAEATRLEGVAGTPIAASGTTPAGPVLASAAEAGIAWKSFKDTFTFLQEGTKKSSTTPGVPDDGEKVLAETWGNASQAAKNALAVLLTRRQELTLARNAYEQRQALRPARKPAEQARMVASVLTALNSRP
jgi:hypothetical protein